VHDNLKHLGLDTLDLVNLRMTDSREAAAITGPFSVLADLQRDGLIRHLGLSNVSAEQVAAAQSIAPVVAVQNFYNLAVRADDALVDQCAEHGIAGRAGLAAAALAGDPAHPRHVQRRSPEGERGRRRRRTARQGHRGAQRGRHRRPVRPVGAALSTRVLVVPGSLRDAAVTTQSASLALAGSAAGITVTLAGGLGLVPLYNQDIDTDVPPRAVETLRWQVADADAVLFISPSHNGSMSAALKNAIDWLSRPRGTAPLLGKPAALLVAGYHVGEAESHLDHVLEKAGARVIAAAGRVVSLRSPGGTPPGEAPAVRDAVASALGALAGAVAR
jgi:chromate reductase